jgi:hypothetical protein
MNGAALDRRSGWRQAVGGVLCAAGLVFGFASEAFAQVQSLDEAVTTLAKNVAGALKDKDGDATINVGTIADPDGRSGGQLIRLKLEEKLAAQGLEIKKRGASFLIRGSYSVDKDEDRHIIAIQTEIVEGKSGKPVANVNEKLFVEEVNKLDDIAAILGLTFDATTEPSVEKQREKIAAKIENPTTAVSSEKTTPEKTAPDKAPPASPSAPAKPSTVTNTDGGSAGGLPTVISAETASPYQIQMLRKSTDPKSGKVSFEPLTASVEDGLAYVDLTTGQIYAIRIFNKAVDHDVAVKVLIDGVSAFSFSQDEFLKSTNLFVIDRGKSGVLRGWHDTGSKFLEFVVSDESAAGKLGAPSSSVGTVTVQFFPSWRVDEPKPKVELLTSRGGTGKGARVDAVAEVVERNFGKTLLATVSVRYDQPAPKPQAAPTTASR